MMTDEHKLKLRNDMYHKVAAQKHAEFKESLRALDATARALARTVGIDYDKVVDASYVRPIEEVKH